MATLCTYCGKQAYLPFTCRSCGADFCDLHRFKENHSCPKIFYWDEIKEDDFKKHSKLSRENKKGDLKSTKGRSRTQTVVAAATILASVLIIFYVGSTVNPLFPVEDRPEQTTVVIPEESVGTFSDKELIEYALQIINEDRKLFNLGPVALSNNKAAQVHADDILKTRAISHWMTNGEKPYMIYAVYGGRGKVSQNVGFGGYQNVQECIQQTAICAKLDPKAKINSTEYAMMYDDASSNWGHRDNILDKHHTHVSLGISYDDYTFVLVQNFENNYIKYKRPINEDRGQVTFAGTVAKGNIYGIEIYYDELPTSKVYFENRDATSYGNGDFIATVVKPLPENQYYEQSSDYTLIVADKWVANDGAADVSFDISPLMTKRGVYTIILTLDADGEVFPVASYPVFHRVGPA